MSDHKAVLATVQSVDVTRARTRIGGTIEKLAVDEGSAVRSGQRIAVVRDPKLPLRLAAIDARIKALNSQKALADIELQRARQLQRRGAASQARVDEARTKIDVVRGELAAAGAERAVVVQQQKEGNVLAPASGRVLAVRVTDGSVVLPGEVVADIAAETYILRLHLPERHARFLKVGDVVPVGARGMEAVADRLGQGRVRQVYPELQRGRVVADVEVAGLGDYFVGERTRVYVATGTRQAIVVPMRYLFRRFGVTFARLQDGSEVVVQPGLPMEGGIEVLSGLHPGDVLMAP